jgi:hypothetical protein
VSFFVLTILSLIANIYSLADTAASSPTFKLYNSGHAYEVKRIIYALHAITGTNSMQMKQESGRRMEGKGSWGAYGGKQRDAMFTNGTVKGKGPKSPTRWIGTDDAFFVSRARRSTDQIKISSQDHTHTHPTNNRKRNSFFFFLSFLSFLYSFIFSFIFLLLRNSQFFLSFLNLFPFLQPVPIF